MDVTVWYHDPTEVSTSATWTGLSRMLAGAQYKDIKTCKFQPIQDLFQYARPDAVISVGEKPLISIEQTKMNPSGHNLPQRFSCFVAAAERGVCGIFYYPEISRRTFSDPNVRYLNLRVPLAQFRLMEIYGIPSISSFWPTASNRLPSTDQAAQRNLAQLVDEILEQFLRGAPITLSSLRQLPAHALALTKMDEAIAKFGSLRRYPHNQSTRRYFPEGFPNTTRLSAVAIDPPPKAQFESTDAAIAGFLYRFRKQSPLWDAAHAKFALRPYTLTWTGTANKARNGSEHPWPGYLTLLDVLYARSEHGTSRSDRTHNLVYALPGVTFEIFLRQINRNTTSARIVNRIADIIELEDGLILGMIEGKNATRLLRSTED